MTTGQLYIIFADNSGSLPSRGRQYARDACKYPQDMKKEKEEKISYWAAHLTTIISVTLVLVLLGIIAMIWTGAVSETRRLKEKIEISVIMADSITDGQTAKLCNELKRTPYARNVALITKEEAMKNWTSSTGENLEELFGVNPLSPEITFTLRAGYSNAASIKKIEKKVGSMPGVEEVASPDLEMVEGMNSNIESLTLILAIVAAAMAVISFVLINNTVHLTVYSRRFSIHTMQLVGATNGFIRRPFILNNLLSGIVAGLGADVLLALALFLAPHAGVGGIASVVSWEDYALIAISLVGVGALVCVLAAWIATWRYLRMNYDELFK